MLTRGGLRAILTIRVGTDGHLRRRHDAVFAAALGRTDLGGVDDALRALVSRVPCALLRIVVHALWTEHLVL